MKEIKNFINPEYEFEKEIGCIKSASHKSLLIRALDKVPDYFWCVPASSSGKYHPKSSLGMGGLVRHTKSVFTISEELLAHPYFGDKFTDCEKDDIRLAIILHDSMKYGEDAKDTVRSHPILVRDACCPLTKEDEIHLWETWGYVCTLIESHMGIWNTDKDGKEILPVPETEVEKFVHMCDYLSSRRVIEVDTTDRTSHTNNTPDWRGEPANEKQIFFIRKLYERCAKKGIAVDDIGAGDKMPSLTKGGASDIIENLKKLLGE